MESWSPVQGNQDAATGTHRRSPSRDFQDEEDSTVMERLGGEEATELPFLSYAGRPEGLNPLARQFFDSGNSQRGAPTASRMGENSNFLLTSGHDRSRGSLSEARRNEESRARLNPSVRFSTRRERSRQEGLSVQSQHPENETSRRGVPLAARPNEGTLQGSNSIMRSSPHGDRTELGALPVRTQSAQNFASQASPAAQTEAGGPQHSSPTIMSYSPQQGLRRLGMWFQFLGNENSRTGSPPAATMDEENPIMRSSLLRRTSTLGRFGVQSESAEIDNSPRGTPPEAGRNEESGQWLSPIVRRSYLHRQRSWLGESGVHSESSENDNSERGDVRLNPPFARRDEESGRWLNPIMIYDPFLESSRQGGLYGQSVFPDIEYPVRTDPHVATTESESLEGSNSTRRYYSLNESSGQEGSLGESQLDENPITDHFSRNLPVVLALIAARTLAAENSPRETLRAARTHANLERPVDFLPTIAIQQGHLDANGVCAVCQNDFALQELAKRLPCLHLFHQNCILPWLSSHNLCPLCRAPAYSHNPRPFCPGAAN